MVQVSHNLRLYSTKEIICIQKTLFRGFDRFQTTIENLSKNRYQIDFVSTTVRNLQNYIPRLGDEKPKT